jgi:hypothetical protein
LRLAIYYIFVAATTWGPPLLGGVASQNASGFAIQFEIINCFQIIAVPLIIFGAPETNFDRAWNSLIQTPATSYSAWKVSQPLRPRGKISKESIKEYLGKMKPISYEGMTDMRTVLQAPRAFVAPTTGLLVLATFLPYSLLWGFSETLSQLFMPMPFMLLPNSLGALMAGPFLLAVGVVAFFSFYQPYHKNFTPYTTVVTLAAGTFLAAAGILAFGLKVNDNMAQLPSTDNDVADAADATTNMFSSDTAGSRLSFPLLSILLGFLAAGVYLLDGVSRPLIWRSTQFTSSNYGVCLRNVCDMGAGTQCWRSLLAGIFVIALPNAFYFGGGLKSTAIGVGVAQILLTAGLAAVWWFFDENIRRMDGKVMGLVDLSMLKRAGSFFDDD